MFSLKSMQTSFIFIVAEGMWETTGWLSGEREVSSAPGQTTSAASSFHTDPDPSRHLLAKNKQGKLNAALQICSNQSAQQSARDQAKEVKHNLWLPTWLESAVIISPIN